MPLVVAESPECAPPGAEVVAAEDVAATLDGQEARLKGAAAEREIPPSSAAFDDTTHA